MKGNIYFLQCPETNEIRYIGQTILPLKKRLQNHIYETKRSIRLGKLLTHKENWISHLIETGLESEIKIQLIEECDVKQIDEREIYWIAYYKSSKLTNIDCGGKRQLVTDETKLKISLANKGEKNGMFGRNIEVSDEIKRKRGLGMIQSEKFQQSRKSKEFRNKISQVRKIDDWLLLNKNKEIIKTFNTANEIAVYLNCSLINVRKARLEKRLLKKDYWVLYKKDYDTF